MKKYLIPITLLALFLAQGCTPDRYAIERTYWRINQQTKSILDNPNGTPPVEVTRVVELLRNFSGSHPGSKLSLKAEFDIANLYLATKEYALAREQLTSIRDRFKEHEGICAEARFLTGISYQREGKLSESAQEFTRLITDYPESYRAFVLPHYFVQYYVARGMDIEASQALKNAITYYAGIAEKHPETKMGLTADLFIAKCHSEMKDWQAAADEFARIFETYRSSGFNLEGVLFNEALIYLKELKDVNKAREILAILVETYPESRYIKTAFKYTSLLEQKEKDRP